MSAVRRTIEDFAGKDLGPDATVIIQTLKRVGLWTSDLHSDTNKRKKLNSSFSTMNSEDIADELGYWSSEASRLSEIHGFLKGQKLKLDYDLKIALATARNQIRVDEENLAAAEDRAPKKFTGPEINDKAELKHEVSTVQQKIVALELVFYAVEAARDSTLTYLSSLSREITRKGDLVKSRL